MMTPQEVASHSFARSTLGGYSMAMVDEFLDTLTEDYTALYNDNAILKGKLKVLSDTVEEYRATDSAMRKAMMAAQKVAEEMVSEAEQKKEQLVHEAEAAAAARVEELKQEVAAEEYRLRQAQEATAAYVRKLMTFHDQEVDFLSRLNELVPPDVAVKDDPAGEIEASMAALYGQDTQPEPEEPTKDVSAAEPEDAADTSDLDPDATKRFEDLQFGRDYKIQ